MRKYRADTRKPSTGQVELSWEIGAGYSRTANGTVQDISMEGMGMLVPLPFEVGAELQIKSDGRKRTATVRRCSRSGSQYLLGVKFDN
jgi:hypothetical protein